MYETRSISFSFFPSSFIGKERVKRMEGENKEKNASGATRYAKCIKNVFYGAYVILLLLIWLKFDFWWLYSCKPEVLYF